MSGMREQEVMHVYWSDLNFKAATVSVTHKPDYGWTPKAYKERSIPIPEKLARSLQVAKAAREKDKTCPLVFPTAGCRPKLNFLDDLKAVAERAGLKPENFFLHKFRATFALQREWKVRSKRVMAVLDSYGATCGTLRMTGVECCGGRRRNHRRHNRHINRLVGIGRVSRSK